MEGSIGKKAQQLNLGALLVIGVIALLLFKPGILGGGTQTTQPPTQTPPSSGGSLGTVEVVGKCGQAVTFTVDMIERYTESTSMSAQNATIVVNGGAPSIKAHGGTLTLAEGDKVIMYYAIDPAQTTYATSKAEGIIPNCKPAVKSSEAIFSPVDSHKIYRTSTAPTTSVVNLKDYTSNPGTALAIAAGGRETERVTLTWAYKEGYGNADGSVLACRFTDSQIDQESTIAELDGVRLGSAKYTPTNTRFSLSATNQSTKYWQVPAIDGFTKGSSILDLIIAGDSNSQPTGATNFSCEVKDTDYYQHNDGSFKIDVEDRDDNSEIGRSAANEIAFNVLLS